jgi:hypothetical protein
MKPKIFRFQKWGHFISSSSRKWSNQSNGWMIKEGRLIFIAFVCFFAIIDLQQGKTLKNVALDILGKIIGGGVCSITVAFDF